MFTQHFNNFVFCKTIKMITFAVKNQQFQKVYTFCFSQSTSKVFNIPKNQKNIP